MKPTRITINDIARRAFVCPATVSSVLTGKALRRRVAVETQQRVIRVAADLGYQHRTRGGKGMAALRHVLTPFMSFLLDSSYRILPDNQQEVWDCDRKVWVSIEEVIEAYARYNQK